MINAMIALGWRLTLSTMVRLKQCMTKASRWPITPSTYAMKTNGVTDWRNGCAITRITAG